MSTSYSTCSVMTHQFLNHSFPDPWSVIRIGIHTCNLCGVYKKYICYMFLFTSVNGIKLTLYVVTIFPFTPPVCVYAATDIAGGFCWKMKLCSSFFLLYILLVTCIYTHIKAKNGKMCTCITPPILMVVCVL